MGIAYKLHTYESVVGNTRQFIVCRYNGEQGPMWTHTSIWYPLAFVTDAQDASKLVVELNKLHQELEASTLSVSVLTLYRDFDRNDYSGGKGNRCPGCPFATDSDSWCTLDCDTFSQYGEEPTTPSQHSEGALYYGTIGNRCPYCIHPPENKLRCTVACPPFKTYDVDT